MTTQMMIDVLESFQFKVLRNVDTQISCKIALKVREIRVKVREVILLNIQLYRFTIPIAK